MSTPIPQPPGVPLFGNIFDVDPSNTWISLQTLWEKYGEIFKITVFGQQIVFVGSVALCEELCDEKRFRKFVGGPIVEIRRAVHASLFTAFADEVVWGVHHRILGPLITPAKVAGHFNDIRDCTSEMIAKWKDLGSDVQISPIDELNRLDIETTTFCFYGRKLGAIKGPEPPVIKAMDRATSEAIKRPTRLGVINWLFYQSKFDQDIKIMRQYATDCLNHRKSNPIDRDDLLHTMMNAKDPVTGESLNETQIIDEIVTMPIGSSTAPCAISSAMYYLAQNPFILKKAQDEVDEVIGDGDFEYEHLEKLPYCTGVVREALRLSAAAPGFNIEPVPETKGPVTLGGKYQVPSNQTMIIVLHGVNRDPEVFEKPEAFEPERMIGDKFEKLPAGAKKWFGNGKRVCFGQTYAFMWSVCVISALLKDLTFEMADPRYKLKQDGWFNLRPVGFHIKVKPRLK